MPDTESRFLPLISVVLATYNGSRYLQEQLNSLVIQTYKNFEIVIVDDGSTDDTIQILKDFAAKHGQASLHINNGNLGYIKNFEKACGLAKGELIALCDQDDYWMPDKLELMQQNMDERPLLYSDSVLCDEKLNPLGENISDRVCSRDFDSCLQQAVFCRTYGHATLIKKSLIEKSIPFLPVIPHDWWLCFNATLHGGMKYLNVPLVKYRQHQANVFGAVGGKTKRLDKEEKKLRKENELSEIRQRVESFYSICPEHLVKEKEELRKLADSYKDFSLPKNFRRMQLFFKNRIDFLASKKRSALRQYLFCLKMFIKIK